MRTSIIVAGTACHVLSFAASAQFDLDNLADRLSFETNPEVSEDSEPSSGPLSAFLLTNSKGSESAFLGGPPAGSPKPPPKAWEATAGVSAGYDTNPGASPDADGTFFVQLSAAVAYTVDLGDDQKLKFAYGLDKKVYEGDFADLRELSQKVTVEYRRPLSERAGLTLRADDLYVHIADDPFLNRLDLTPAVRYSPLEPLASTAIAIDISYTYSNLEYLVTPSNPVRNADADRHALGAALVLLPGGALQPYKPFFRDIIISFAHTWNMADGSDVDYRGKRIELRARKIRFWDEESIWVDLGASHEWNDYSNPNSALSDGAARDDEVDKVWVQAFVSVKKWRAAEAVAFVRLEHRHQGSNIIARDFDENLLYAGVTFNF